MAQDQDPAASVYDFLYVDLPRLGSLLSQFGEDGVLTELTRQTDEASETGGAIGPKFAQLNSKDAAKRGLTRKFDPRWMVPLRFLDVVQHILHRDITSASLGQLVLIEGAVGISDLSMLKALWGESLVRETIAKSIPQEDLDSAGLNRQERRRQGDRRARNDRPEKPDLSSFVGTLLTMLPHAVQATFLTEDHQRIWGTLSPEHLISTSSDLLLKHGTALSGRWHMVGILDAIPTNIHFDELQFVVSELHKLTPLGQILGNIMPILEGGFSRPPGAFGVTPLVIMRTIDGRTATASEVIGT